MTRQARAWLAKLDNYFSSASLGAAEGAVGPAGGALGCTIPWTCLKLSEELEMPVPCSPTCCSASLVSDKGNAWTLPMCEQQQRVSGAQEPLLHLCGS